MLALFSMGPDHSVSLWGMEFPCFSVCVDHAQVWLLTELPDK